MVIKVEHKGDFKHLEKFLNKVSKNEYLYSKLAKYGQRGVEALSAATPKDTGKTASSWGYEVVVNEKAGYAAIQWSNTNVNKGINIAMLLQYGHGTRHGGYVQGVDYINPALKPVFDELANDAWKEVIAK